MEQATKCATGLTLKVLSPTKFLLGCTSLFYSVFSILKQFRKSWGHEWWAPLQWLSFWTLGNDLYTTPLQPLSPHVISHPWAIPH